MKYLIHNDDLNIKDKILNLNNVKLEDIELTDFEVDYNQEIVINFLNKIIENKDKSFLIVGDYDCDGICATAIITSLLNKLKIKNNYYIPSRTKEGYGLNENIVSKAINYHFDALFLVDNGVAVNDLFVKCRENNILTFVIDHHECEKIPQVDAILHPSLFVENYENMCAAGICSLLSNTYEYDELSLVYGGLATLSDMVKVHKYNRFLCKKMMNILKNKDIYTINYLLNNEKLSYDSLLFQAIPKINAVSRLDDLVNVNYLVKYLLANRQDAYQFLPLIEKNNQRRKDLTNKMLNLSLKMIDESANVIVLKSDSFIEGLCGLLANKIMNIYKKPCLVFACVDGVLKGSGRSMKGFDIFNYLYSKKHLFLTFGGHEMAVGLSLNEGNLDELINHLNNADIKNDEVIDVIELKEEEINNDLIESIEQLKPFGTGFKEPLFCIKNHDYKVKYITENKYPKFMINNNLSAISFNENIDTSNVDYLVGHISRSKYRYFDISIIIEDFIRF